MLLSSLCLLWVRPLHSPAPHGACQGPSPSPRQAAIFHWACASAFWQSEAISLWPWLRSGKTKHRWPHLSRKMGKSIFVCWSQEHLCVCSVEILDLFRLIYILSALSSDIWVGGPVSGGKTVLPTRSQRKDNQFLSQRLVVHRKSTVSKCVQSQYGTWGASKSCEAGSPYESFEQSGWHEE